MLSMLTPEMMMILGGFLLREVIPLVAKFLANKQLDALYQKLFNRKKKTYEAQKEKIEIRKKDAMRRRLSARPPRGRRKPTRRIS